MTKKDRNTMRERSSSQKKKRERKRKLKRRRVKRKILSEELQPSREKSFVRVFLLRLLESWRILMGRGRKKGEAEEEGKGATEGRKIKEDRMRNGE